jgi:hypothetical protein
LVRCHDPRRLALWNNYDPSGIPGSEHRPVQLRQLDLRGCAADGGLASTSSRVVLVAGLLE